MATPAQIRANQANSQKSTGPKSADGKARSSRNSFKHGLYAKELVLPNENSAELDQLRASLRAEHQPANTTEEILVNDLAENFWRLRRMREFETRAMQPENIVDWHRSGLLAVVQRTMGSAERGFHKALSSLRRLQKDRGFAPGPANGSAEEIGFVLQQDECGAGEIGFVREKSDHDANQGDGSPELSGLAARQLAALREEMRSFVNTSCSVSAEEGFRAFAEHVEKRCLAQLDRLPEAA